MLRITFLGFQGGGSKRFEVFESQTMHMVSYYQPIHSNALNLEIKDL